MTPEQFMILCAAIMGAVCGSFLNVLIYRLPRGEGVVAGRSKCPRCHKTISWYDNVPLVSYIVLRGRCRHCRWHIPLRYPLVEAISTASAAAIVWHFGPTLAALWSWFFVIILTTITFIDWAHQIIPDTLSLGGVVLGWIGAAVALHIDVVDSIVGSLVGAGIILAIAVAYRLVRKIHGMGGGDVKLMAMIGAFLGWRMVFPVLFIAAFFGSVYGLWLMRGKGDGKTAVAFGSFLAPAAGIMMFFGHRLIALYLGAVPR